MKQLATAMFVREHAGGIITGALLLAILCFGMLHQVAAQAPGGISSNLVLWLKADSGVYEDKSGYNIGTDLAEDGDTVQSWADLSGARTNDPTDTEPTFHGPYYRNNASQNINFNPVLDFSAGDEVGFTLGSDYIFSTNNGLSMLVVASPINSGNPNFIYDFGFNGATTYYLIYAQDLASIRTPLFHGGEVTNFFSARGDVPTIISGVFDFGNEQEMFLDGQEVESTAITTSQLTAAEIGEAQDRSSFGGPVTIGGQCKLNPSTDRFFDGRLAELIVYDEDLDELGGAAKDRIESYLAIKYGITLDTDTATDTTNFDYQAANGTVVWPGTSDSAYRSHHHDVAGIGIDTTSGLNQPQSKSVNDSSILTISGASNLEAEEFLMWGHNGAIKFEGIETDLPTGIEKRWSRVWKFKETGDVGTVTLSWDNTDMGPVTLSDLRLLIDRDGDGFSDGDVTPISGATFGSVQFTGVDLQDGDLLTLGSVNKAQTPLPITLSYFDLEVLNGQVQLHWRTASELNNDFFTVERSADGINFEPLMQVEAAGNSSKTNNYSAWDRSPLSGNSYYRLRQTDFDGSFSYSPIITAFISPEMQEANLSIYPNPTAHRLAVESDPEDLSEVRIFNTLGIEVLQLDFSGRPPTNRIQLDLSELAPGMYLLKTKRNAQLIIKQKH